MREETASPPARDGRSIAGGPSATRLTATSWQAEGALGLREWGEHGRRLGGIGRAVGWWIGDWLRYGNTRFGERYARAARLTGYDVQTLMNMVYVATRYDCSQRREGLSWSHHAEVCALPLDERERWLDLAEKERLSSRCLRDEVRRARRREAADQLQETARPALPRDDAPAADHERVCPQCGTVLADGSHDQPVAAPASA